MVVLRCDRCKVVNDTNPVCLRIHSHTGRTLRRTGLSSAEGIDPTRPLSEPQRVPNLKTMNAARLPTLCFCCIFGSLLAHSLSRTGCLAAESATVLSIDSARFTINRKPAFLYGISYYGALGAPVDFIRQDLDDMQRFGFNWLRVWANWTAFGADAAAVDEEGRPIAGGLEKLKWLVRECDRRGMIVDVTFSRGASAAGRPRLQDLKSHGRAVETVITALRPWRNWYLDLSNERNIRDQRFTSLEDLKSLRDSAKQLAPQLLLTASQGGDISPDELPGYLEIARLDFVSPHRPRNARSPAETEEKSRKLLAAMKALGRVVPVHHQEPFRRGYGPWNPTADDFATDLRGALAGGAAGWCFHNGDQHEHPDGQPRRSFDLRSRRLFDQLDSEELRTLDRLKQWLPAP